MEVETIRAKTIIQKIRFDGDLWFGIDYNMNLYKGCPFGCIYCDSRSDRYYIDDFDRVRVKDHAVDILSDELQRLKKKGVVGIGSMSDTYNPFERDLNVTQEALKMIKQYRFGVSIDTKSDLILRDTGILKAISDNNSAIVKITITTASDKLSKIIEPNACPSSERFLIVRELNEAGIFCGILLTPMIPFLTDTDDEIKAIVKKAAESKAKFIYCMYGMTMRDSQRDYFYHNLAKTHPGLAKEIRHTYGAKYICDSPRKLQCEGLLKSECKKYGILTEMKEVIEAYKTPEEESTQLSFI